MYTTHRTVAISDTDAQAQLKSGAAADFMIECCSFQMDAEKKFAEYMHQNGLAVFLASRQMDIIRRPLYGEKLIVKTSVYDCMSIFGSRNTVIYDAHGKICYMCHAEGVFVDVSNGRPVKLPPEIRDSITVDAKLEMDYMPRKIAIPSSGQSRIAEPFRVKRFHLDANRHMNSSRYIDEAEDLLEDDFNYDRIRVEYKVQAKRGEHISMEIYSSSKDVRVIVMRNEQGHTNAVAEFSTRINNGSVENKELSAR